MKLIFSLKFQCCFITIYEIQNRQYRTVKKESKGIIMKQSAAVSIFPKTNSKISNGKIGTIKYPYILKITDFL